MLNNQSNSKHSHESNCPKSSLLTVNWPCPRVTNDQGSSSCITSDQCIKLDVLQAVHVSETGLTEKRLHKFSYQPTKVPFFPLKNNYHHIHQVKKNLQLVQLKQIDVSAPTFSIQYLQMSSVSH